MRKTKYDLGHVWRQTSLISAIQTLKLKNWVLETIIVHIAEPSHKKQNHDIIIWCGVVWLFMSSTSLCVACLVPSWWCYFVVGRGTCRKPGKLGAWETCLKVRSNFYFLPFCSLHVLRETASVIYSHSLNVLPCGGRLVNRSLWNRDPNKSLLFKLFIKGVLLHWHNSNACGL